MADRESDRGKRASFDRRTGEVSGSGAGAGNPDDRTEDYDSDVKRRMPAEKPGGVETGSSPGGGG